MPDDENWPLLGGNPLAGFTTETALPPFAMRNGGDPEFEAAPPPRQWILGNSFCRGYLSSLVAEGGTGKSALRMAQAIAVATGRPLTGEKVFQQTRVLYLSLEDDLTELLRRQRAALMFHQIGYSAIRDNLWLASPGTHWEAGEPISRYTLAYADRRGDIKIGDFLAELEKAIANWRFGLVIVDPFVKLHALNENSNAEVDFICRVLASIAMHQNVAIDLPHHTSKLAVDGSLSSRARGGSAFRDAVRLLYTLTGMTTDEAALLGIDDELRRSLVRLDPGKVNIARPALDASWFRLHSVNLGNGADNYPNGDDVQTAAPWVPPRHELSIALANQILDDIQEGLPNGQRYSNAGKVDEERKAWRLVQRHAPLWNDAQAKDLIKTWIINKTLRQEKYADPISRNQQSCLVVGVRPC